MPKKPSGRLGDTTPVAGGVPLPAHLIVDMPDDWDTPPTDDLGLHAYWLLKLHAGKVSLKFHKSDLAAMDNATKRLLIADIQESLGVSPFRKNVL